MGKHDRRVMSNPLIASVDNCFTFLSGIFVLPNPAVSTSMYDRRSRRTSLTAVSLLELASQSLFQKYYSKR